MRTKKQIEIIKQNQSPPEQLSNIVSKSKVQQLIQYYKDSKKIQKNTGPVVSYVREGDGIIDDIISKLRIKFGNFTVRTAHFFEVEKPHIIHNDDDYEYPNSFKAFTIPLEIKGNEINNAKLVFFDQYYYGGPAKFVKNANIDDKPQYYNKFITEYNQVENIVDSKISQEDKNLISHISEEWLEGLSIQTYFPWHIGSIIAFDSLQLHCASNFLATGATSKLGLSIFTTLD